MQGIRGLLHEFQIDCLNLVHRYRQRRQLFSSHSNNPHDLASHSSTSNLGSPSAAAVLASTSTATWQAPPQQQQQPQQQPPASPAITFNLDAAQSPQFFSQSSWTRTTEWEPGMPPAPSATLSRLLHQHLQCRRCQATFKTPVTLTQLPGPDPGVRRQQPKGISPQPSSPPRNSTHHQSNGIPRQRCQQGH
ncbi:hypothetical protein HOLleu_41450 [Holothuria leucospilota]|uniref:Uncharacterized protein n=1 Tax=Holothuria leucospilota TaxID=206669 RepID=A0A9Q1BAQ6_HOLLE|nr:hypothetical protein HOLleu_41450 [Holothuria leucospilota]